MKKSPEIFKVQLPIAGEALALVYNKKGTTNGQIPITKDLRKLMGDEYKKFVFGKRHDSGVLEIFSEAPWQEW